MEYVKKIDALEVDLKQKNNQYESVCRERYAFQRNLQEAKEEISDLKSKYKETIQTLERIRDEAKENSVQLVEQIGEKEKAVKEVENLKDKTKRIQENFQNCKSNVENELKEGFRLKKMISVRDHENTELKKEIEWLRKEKDMFKNSLHLKNDEILSLHQNLNELENTILSNRTQYNQKVEEIHLIGREMENLRREKSQLLKVIEESKSLKKKISNLEEDLLQEKVKSKVFEEELSNPLNFHHWRKLQAADPERYELILKIQFLQKRLLNMAENGVEQEGQLKEARKLTNNLEKKIERFLDREFPRQLHTLQSCLHQQKRKNKALEAELKMYKSQALDYKHTIDLKNEEINRAMRIVLDKKKTILSTKEKDINEISNGLSSANSKKPHFKGGGFRQTSSSPI